MKAQELSKRVGARPACRALGVPMDIFSRYVVGWMVAPRECSNLATRLIEETFHEYELAPDALVLHSDRGSPMIAKGTAQLLAQLGITRSLSRPRVSNDNPFSESQFKTVKYTHGFPSRVGSIEDARAFCQRFSPGTTTSTGTPASP